MNKIYKVIKNRRTGLWIVVSELISGKAGQLSVALALGVFAPSALAEITASDSGPSNIYTAENGKTTVVDILPPNNSGLSHNRYKAFNVDKGGLILNNADSLNNVTIDTELAGQVLANTGLAESAEVILNEVFSSGGSQLRGFTEVGGRSADVVIADLNGVHCDGCGFINTPKITLTTGVPQLDQEGRLERFDVSQGQLSISGVGIDATQAEALNLISQSLKVTGPVTAKNIKVRAGTAAWNYDTAEQEAPLSESNGKPEYAIDSYALGGMYADTISLKATDEGVGVRMLGEYAAVGGDFVLEAAGGIEITGRLSSARDLILGTSSDTHSSVSPAIKLHDSSVTASRDLELSAEGAVVSSGGQVYAGEDIRMDLGSWVDSTTDNPQKNNNSRFSGGDFSVNVELDAELKKSQIKSIGDFDLSAYAIFAGQAGTQIVSNKNLSLNARSGDLDLSATSVFSAEDMQLHAANTITTTDAATQEISAEKTLTIESYDLLHAGALQAVDGTDISATEVQQSGTMLLSTDGSSDDNLTVTRWDSTAGSTLQSANNMTWQGVALSHRGSIRMNNASLSIDDVDVYAGAQIRATGDLALTVDNIEMKASNASLMGGMDGVADTTLNVSSKLLNNGVLHSGRDLSATAGTIENTVTGGLSAARDLNLTVTNSASHLKNLGAIYSGNDLTVNSAGSVYNDVVASRSASGVLLGTKPNGTDVYEYNQVIESTATTAAGGDIDITAVSFRNTSQLDAQGDMTISARTLLNQVPNGDTRAETGPMNVSGANAVASYEIDGFTFLGAGWSRERTDYLRTWIEQEYYTGLGRPSNIPQITAGGTLTLSDFLDARNLGAILQAPTVNLTTSIAGADYKLDTLPVYKHFFKETWSTNVDYDCVFGACVFSPRNHYTYNRAVVEDPAQPLLIHERVSRIGANSLNASGFALTVAASTYDTSGMSSGQQPGLPNAAQALLGRAFILPSNPNGFFITNREPSAKYLIEINPLFNKGVSTVGTDYLSEQLNLNSETEQKRLGDSNYESYLVKQQLIEQIGTTQLNGYQDMAEVMTGMMDAAVSQASALGLEYGVAPTPQQLANLTEDIIWMVETEVEGQIVLAPVVYLSDATVQAYAESPQIVADDAVMELAALTNEGGVIDVKGDLDITAKGDITNTSGTIRGGNVNVESTDGSIVNQTMAIGRGGEDSYSTTLGKTAGIEASGNLGLKAKEDITNIGANVSAGGDASLDAGGDITFDTIENKTTTRTVQTGGTAGGYSAKRESSQEHMGSGLTVGGDLKAKAGNDITIAGSEVDVGGDASIDAANDLNIVSRENVYETSEESRSSNRWSGASTKTTKDQLSIRNKATTLNIGGDADLTAGDGLLVQGSDINVEGSAAIEADSVTFLAGRNLDQTTTRTESTSMFGGGAEEEPSADGSSGEGVTLMQKTIETEERLSQRSVGSNLKVGEDLSINAKETVTLQGSEVESGGDLSVEAKNIELLAAQNIESVKKTKQTIKIGLYSAAESDSSGEAGTSSEAGTETGTETGAEANPEGLNAPASASAGAQAEAGVGANASGQASAAATVDLMRIQTNTSEDVNITNTGSAFKSGGSMKIKAEEKLRLVGSELEAEGDVDLAATDMSFEAAQDISYSKKTSQTQRMGIYAEAGASGSASAGAGASGEASAEASAGVNGSSADAGAKAGAEGSAQAKAEAEGGAKAGVGLQFKDTKRTEESGSTTAMVSMIKSKSGSISRKAKNNITDVGTEIEAAESFQQEAKSIDMLAARNTQFESSSFEQTTVKLGVYVEADGEAEAEAKAEAEAGVDHKGEAKAEGEVGASASAEGGARAGIEARVNRYTSQERTDRSQAVVSNIKAGGSVNSKSTEDSTFEGTNIAAGEDLNIEAAALNVLAAEDTETTTSSEDSLETRLAVNIGVGGEASAEASANSEGDTKAEAEAEGGVKVGVEAEVHLSQASEQSRESNAVVANFSAGNINLKSSEKTTLEGTNLDAEENISVEAESLDYKAAQDTYSSSSSSSSMDMELQVEATIIGSGGVDAEGSVDVELANSQESGSNAVTGSINAGNGLTIVTKDDLRLEGTEVNTGGDATLAAGGNVTIDAARNTHQSSSDSLGVSASASLGEESIEASVGIEGESEKSSEAVAGGINSGGNLTISAGKSANFEGTDLGADGNVILAAKDDVNFNAAMSTSESSSNNLDVEVGLNFGDGELEAGVEVGNESERSAEAKTGSVSAGNSFVIVAGNDANFEGTELEAEGDAVVVAGNDLNFTAARNTSSAESTSVEVGVGLGEDEQSLDVGVGISRESSDEAVAGSLQAGGSVTMAAGNNATFEGTDLGAGDALAIAAGGDVNFKAAESRSESFGLDVGIGLSSDTSEVEDSEDDKPAQSAALKEEPESGKTDAAEEAESTENSDAEESAEEAEGEQEEEQEEEKETETANSAKLKLGLDVSNSVQRKGSNITAGEGGVSIISGGAIDMEGTSIATDGTAALSAVEGIRKRAAESSSVGFGLALEASTTTTTKNPVENTDESAAGETEDSAASNDSEASTEAEQTANTSSEENSATADGEDNEAPRDAEESQPAPGPKTKNKAKAGGRLSLQSGKTETTINAAGGVSKATQKVAGTDFSVPVQTLADGSKATTLPLSPAVSEDNPVKLTDSSGNALPDWVSFESGANGNMTGALVARPPADFEGKLEVVVEVPQADGSSKKIGLVIEP